MSKNAIFHVSDVQQCAYCHSELSQSAPGFEPGPSDIKISGTGRDRPPKPLHHVVVPKNTCFYVFWLVDGHFRHWGPGGKHCRSPEETFKLACHYMAKSLMNITI